MQNQIDESDISCPKSNLAVANSDSSQKLSLLCTVSSRIYVYE